MHRIAITAVVLLAACSGDDAPSNGAGDDTSIPSGTVAGGTSAGDRSTTAQGSDGLPTSDSADGSTTRASTSTAGSDDAAAGSESGDGAEFGACWREWTFEDCPGEWTASEASAESEAVSWACGNPSVGPAVERGFHEWMWGTALDGPFPGGESSYLTSPSFDLSQCEGAKIFLEVEHWGEFANGCSGGAGGYFEISTDGGSAWTKVEPFFNGYEGTISAQLVPPDGELGYCDHTGAEISQFDAIWQISPMDLSELGGAPDVRFRLVFGSRFSSGHAGWYIDHVSIEAYP